MLSRTQRNETDRPLPIDQIGILTISEFLTGAELTAAVRRIAGGKDLRCAVAFWGNGVGAFLTGAGAVMDDAKIVCDLSMGGCHPDALVELGAPANANLRHRPGLHAKIYLSNEGVVIGSANASNNGLGFGTDGARHLEAATFHGPSSDIWKSASEWFDRTFASSSPLDKAALELARLNFDRGLDAEPARSVRPGSLLDMVIAHPEAFEGVGFVFCSTSSTEKQRDAARRSARKAGIPQEVIDETSEHDMFIGWDEQDVRRWPVSFIEFWMPGRKLRMYARTIRALDPVPGNVFARKSKRALRKLLPDGCPEFNDAAEIDADLAGRLIAQGGGM